LIELTGDPKRTVRLGDDKTKDGYPARMFSFDQFKFPSCTSCNDEFSNLETQAKTIIDKIMLLDNVSAAELSVLLDWFDKLRIGIWLGFFYLDKNFVGINPKFYIRQRMGEHDRLLCIYRARSERECLHFIGFDTPSFYFAPCCFTLRINSFSFFNLSYMFLFARRMGLPYGSEAYYLPNEEDPYNYITEVSGTEGIQRIMTPLLRKLFCIQGTELYQPMFPHLVKQETAFYDNDYVRNMSMNWEGGVGKIFKQDGLSLLEYPHEPTKDWLPLKTYDINSMAKSVVQQTFEWQIYINENTPSMDRIPKEEQKYWLKVRKVWNGFNRKQIERVKKMIFTDKNKQMKI